MTSYILCIYLVYNIENIIRIKSYSYAIMSYSYAINYLKKSKTTHACIL